MKEFIKSNKLKLYFHVTWLIGGIIMISFAGTSIIWIGFIVSIMSAFGITYTPSWFSPLFIHPEIKIEDDKP